MPLPRDAFPLIGWLIPFFFAVVFGAAWLSNAARGNGDSNPHFVFVMIGWLIAFVWLSEEVYNLCFGIAAHIRLTRFPGLPVRRLAAASATVVALIGLWGLVVLAWLVDEYLVLHIHPAYWKSTRSAFPFEAVTILGFLFWAVWLMVVADWWVRIFRVHVFPEKEGSA